MRAWDGVTASKQGERQSVTGAKEVRLNLYQGPYWQPHTALYGHL